MPGKKNSVAGLWMVASMLWFGLAVFRLRPQDGRSLP